MSNESESLMQVFTRELESEPRLIKVKDTLAKRLLRPVWTAHDHQCGQADSASSEVGMPASPARTIL